MKHSWVRSDRTVRPLERTQDHTSALRGSGYAPKLRSDVYESDIYCSLLPRPLCVSARPMTDSLSRDPRTKFSIGSNKRGSGDGHLQDPHGLAFDHHRGVLFVADTFNHRVQVFSSEDGSFVTKFGSRGHKAGRFQFPWGIAVDNDRDRVLVADYGNHRVQAWSLSQLSFVSSFGKYGTNELEFCGIVSLAIDKRHDRLLVIDGNNKRLQVLSAIDGSFLFAWKLSTTFAVAVDDVRGRIIVTDSEQHRVQVVSSVDGSALFEFGSLGDRAGEFNFPRGVCVDLEGRIIVADASNFRVQAFTPEGQHLASLACGSETPFGVAVDEYRGLIGIATETRVHVLGGLNQWLPRTPPYTWSPARHVQAPFWIKQAVLTIAMIRSLVDESSLSMIPNELLFEIFSLLDPLPFKPPTRQSVNSVHPERVCQMM